MFIPKSYQKIVFIFIYVFIHTLIYKLTFVYVGSTIQSRHIALCIYINLYFYIALVEVF